MRTIFIKSILLLLVTAISCSDLEENITDPNNYEPDYLVSLKIGNSWTYQITRFNTEGEVTSMDTITYSIIKDTTVDGTKWFIENDDELPFHHSGVKNDETGFYRTDFKDIVDYYKYPAKSGDVTGDRAIVSIDTVLQTPLGKLKCYQYQHIIDGFPMNIFYSPQYGKVFSENIGRPWGGQYYIFQTYQLIDVNYK